MFRRKLCVIPEGNLCGLDAPIWICCCSCTDYAVDLFVGLEPNRYLKAGSKVGGILMHALLFLSLTVEQHN